MRISTVRNKLLRRKLVALLLQEPLLKSVKIIFTIFDFEVHPDYYRPLEGKLPF